MSSDQRRQTQTMDDLRSLHESGQKLNDRMYTTRCVLTDGAVCGQCPHPMPAQGTEEE